MTMTARPAYNIPAGLACGAAAGAAWGLVFVAPLLLGSFTPFALSIARYLAYGIIALILIAPRWPRLKNRVTRADWIALLLLSMTGNIIYYVFVAAAVQLGGIQIASFVVGLLPIAVTLVGSREAGALSLRRLGPPLLLIGIGLVLINQDLFTHGAGAQDGLKTLAGIACAVVALASWTHYAVANARYLRRVPHLSNQDWSLLTGLATGAIALVLSPLILIGNLHHDLDAWLWFALVNAVLAIAASVVGNGLWNAASRFLPLTLSGQMIIFETLFALAYGFMLEQRLPRLLEVLAIVALVAGVAWSARRHGASPH